MKRGIFPGRSAGLSRRSRYWVQVRRERPSGLAMAIALLLAMLMAYLSTLGTDKGWQSVMASPRVTREVTFEKWKMHLVCVGRCDNEAQARLLAAGDAGGGAGYVWKDEKDYRVLAAGFEGQADARRWVRRLSQTGAGEGEVISLEASAVAMRMTGPEMTIGAIGEGEALLRDQVRAMGDMAVQLEAGEMDIGTARTLCAVAATRTRGALALIKAMPDGDENRLCKMLTERLDSLQGLLQTVSQWENQNASALAGRLRGIQIDVFLKALEMHDQLLKKES